MTTTKPIYIRRFTLNSELAPSQIIYAAAPCNQLALQRKATYTVHMIDWYIAKFILCPSSGRIDPQTSIKTLIDKMPGLLQ